MHKRLCACGCEQQVTQKVESQHMNALAPALLASQVLDQNRTLISRKKRSQAIGFPAHFCQQLAMANTTEIDGIDMDDGDDEPVSRNSPIMIGEDLDEAYGQSKSCHLVKLMRILYESCRIIWPYIYQC